MEEGQHSHVNIQRICTENQTPDVNFGETVVHVLGTMTCLESMIISMETSISSSVPAPSTINSGISSWTWLFKSSTNVSSSINSWIPFVVSKLSVGMT